MIRCSMKINSIMGIVMHTCDPRTQKFKVSLEVTVKTYLKKLKQIDRKKINNTVTHVPIRNIFMSYWIPSTSEVEVEVQGHLWLPIEFEGSLGYISILYLGILPNLSSNATDPPSAIIIYLLLKRCVFSFLSSIWLDL